MANPQLENGFVKIAGELVSALCRANLCAYESRVVWCIFQKTYGWNKKADRISVSQFEAATKLKRRHISRTLASLIQRNIITRTGEGQYVEYGLQKDHDLWKNSSLRLEPPPMEVTETFTCPGDAASPVEETVANEQPSPIQAEPSPQMDKGSPKEVTKPSPEEVHTKAIKHITKAKTKAVGGFSKDSFETYQQSLRGRFPELDFDLELEKFNLYWYGGARRVKNPKLALLNWMDKARQFLKENQRYGTGINQKYPSASVAANGTAPRGYPEHDLESWNRD